MASNVLRTSEPMRHSTVHKPVNRTLERLFFGGMAVLLCVIVVVGFTPTYYGAGWIHAPLPSPIVHIHGAIFSLWMIVFLIQSALIPAGKVKWHRSLGTFAFCLPPIMIVVGWVAAVDALRRGARIGPLDPVVSLALPLLDIVAFSIVIFMAWRTRRKPDTHKRLVLLATIALVAAAIARFHWNLTPATGASVGIGILVLAVVGYDLIALRRIHRATLWAAPLTFASTVLPIPVGMTAAWHQFAAFLLKIM